MWKSFCFTRLLSALLSGFSVSAHLSFLSLLPSFPLSSSAAYFPHLALTSMWNFSYFLLHWFLLCFSFMILRVCVSKNLERCVFRRFIYLFERESRSVRTGRGRGRECPSSLPLSTELTWDSFARLEIRTWAEPRSCTLKGWRHPGASPFLFLRMYILWNLVISVRVSVCVCVCLACYHFLVVDTFRMKGCVEHYKLLLQISSKVHLRLVYPLC